MAVLPSQGGSPGTWGTELNNVILTEHNNDGTHRIPKYKKAKIVDDTTVFIVGDGQVIFDVDAEIAGMNLVDADAYVTTNSSSGLVTVQIRRIRAGVNADMLSTRITIDANEPTSYTAAAGIVVNTANDDVALGDLIAIDVDTAGTGAKGLGVTLKFSP